MCRSGVRGGSRKEARVSTVHYVTFALNDVQAQAFVQGYAPVSFEVCHRDYSAACVLAPDVRASLAKDLAG